MGLETVTNIADFIRTNPTGADPISQGDNHIQNIKIALTNDFAGFVGAVLITGVDGGAANAYTLTPAQALTAYANKMLVEFTPAANSTGASTLNISGLGVKPIVTQAGVAISADDLVAGCSYLAAYDGTSFRLISVTTAYVDAVRAYATSLAFSSALPSISGAVADYFTTNDGATGSWSNLLKATVIRFKDGADASKLLAFSLSGITTATTRTVTIPDKSGTMAMTSDLVFVFSTGFLSADQTITFAGTLTIAHGLGAIPKVVTGFLKCTTAELGYSIGDIVCIPIGQNGATASSGASVNIDATNLVVRYGSSGNPISILHKTTGSASNITTANWTFHMRAFA